MRRKPCAVSRAHHVDLDSNLLKAAPIGAAVKFTVQIFYLLFAVSFAATL